MKLKHQRSTLLLCIAEDMIEDVVAILALERVIVVRILVIVLILGHGTKTRQDLLDLQEILVLPDQEIPEILDLQVLLVTLEILVLLDLEIPVPLVLPVLLVLLVIKVEAKKDQLDPRGLKDLKDVEDILVHEERKVAKEIKVIKEIKVRPDLKDPKVREENTEM